MYLLKLPERSHWFLFLLTVTFLWLLLLLPYAYAWLNTPPNHYCTLLIGFPETEVCDQNFYIAWGTAQAANGHLLFEDKLNGFTAQRLVFNSWWLLTGKLCGWLKLDIYLFNQIQRFVVIPVLCLVLFNFTTLFFAEKRYRFLALWLMLFSGYNLSPYPEGNMFESMLWEVILPVAHVFFIVAVYFCYRVFSEHGSALKAGVACFIMSTVYPYTTVSVCFLMLCAFLLLIYFRKISWQVATQKYLTIFVFTIPMVLYNYYIVSTDTRYIDGIAHFTSQPVWNFLPAYGLLLVLAIVAVPAILKTKDMQFVFLTLWLACILVQVYFPVSVIPFQIQLILGIQIPMSLLAVYSFKRYVDDNTMLRLSTVFKNFVFGVLFFSASATNGYMYFRILKSISKQQMPTYLENDIIESLMWMKQQAKEEDVVLATPIVSSYIPVLTNCRIYSSDYYAPTPDFSEKEKMINWVFSPDSVKTNEELSRFFEENHINYVFENNYYNRKNNVLNMNRLAEFSLLQNVYENKRVRIYKIKHEP